MLNVYQEIKIPVLIAHAENDWDIPHSHSDVLFNALLEPFLPPLPVPPTSPASWSTSDWSAYTLQQARRGEARAALVARTSIPNFGYTEKFDSDSQKVVLLKTFAGGHDRIGTLEGVQDTIGRVFQIGSREY